ncbi:MAG: SDR family NAD(P)-dependent oxidoreductase [Pseudonocardia sp.]|uniref:oxidoreductase n=1 Tax=unclassified Pseudonocardia TaxID=2619320 RepID=UPI00086D4942|nr:MULTISPECIES: oxidoreductase [unclassified Pseudonocardia]MBN9109386.1 SDR family NAD(P)-dependent oxidoreductase [Pseudonocardia sp.]ODU29966.1 MAG: short-chain dehydrogenase/reductase [Pseudonocardia sp. SCN 72-51]ODV08097.1 MAG: short-chain dehydrogenase/reductase [Pseudonocardia sp. SCN 73-27]
MQRTWFITGAAGGLGRALTEAALARGDTVVGSVRRAEHAAELEALAPTRCFAEILDLTAGDAAIRAAVESAIARAGDLDVVVNNAGYGLVGAAEEVSDTEARHQFETNFFGALSVLRAVLPHLRARRRGHIINLSSATGLFGSPGLALYSASKFALEGLSEALQSEVTPWGIRVTIVEPGAFRTDWAGRSIVKSERVIDGYADGGSTRDMIDSMNGNQAGDPARLAAAVLTVVDADEPPLRLLLGTGLPERVRQKHERMSAEIAAWRHITDSTSFESTP